MALKKMVYIRQRIINEVIRGHRRGQRCLILR
jgi:hypothetical protein